MTYSIVARDRETGEFGVAVQSHYFQVGPIVPWARSGVGAVATQSQGEARYGSLGLELMAHGYGAERALAAVMAADATPEVRQVAMIDSEGRVAAHTGTRCIAMAGHRLGEEFSCQANLMERDTVWDAMSEAYRQARGPLAERLLIALEAAEAEGGDIRGRQSAAILVVSGTPSGMDWADRTVDLRVEDHPDPLAEMRRLWQLRQAYDAAGRAGGLAESGDMQGAAQAESQALELSDNHVELSFWIALGRIERGELEAGMSLLRPIFDRDPRWIETLRRLPPSGAASEALVARVLAAV